MIFRTAVTALIVLLQIVPTAAGSERLEKPNFVLILTDDPGWQNLKCDDIDKPCLMETPNIDAIGTKNGIAFRRS
jgi:arylsulfatase A-like enzyme